MSLSMAWQVPVWSAEIIADRVDFVESSNTVEPGSFQLEFGLAGENFRQSAGDRDYTLPGLIRIGVFSMMEARIESGWLTANNSGVAAQDIDLGAKFHLWDESSLPLSD